MAAVASGTLSPSRRPPRALGTHGASHVQGTASAGTMPSPSPYSLRGSTITASEQRGAALHSRTRDRSMGQSTRLGAADETRVPLSSYSQRFLVDSTTTLDGHRQVQELQARIQQLLRQLHGRDEECVTLKSELAKARAEKEAVRANMEVVFQDLVAKQNFYRDEVETLKQRFEREKKQHRETSIAWHREKNLDVESIQRQVEAWREEAGRKTSELTALRHEAVEARRTIDEMAENLRGVLEERDRLARDMEELKVRGAVHSEEVGSLLEKLGKADGFIQRLSDEAVEHVEKIEHLEAALVEQRQKHSSEARAKSEVILSALQAALKCAENCDAMSRACSDLVITLREERENSSAVMAKGAGDGSCVLPTCVNELVDLAAPHEGCPVLQRRASPRGTGGRSPSREPICIPPCVPTDVEQQLWALLALHGMGRVDCFHPTNRTDSTETEASGPRAWSAEELHDVLVDVVQRIAATIQVQCEDVRVVRSAMRAVSQSNRLVERTNHDLLLLQQAAQCERDAAVDDVRAAKLELQREREATVRLQGALDQTAHIMEEAAQMGIQRSKRTELLLRDNEDMELQVLEQRKENARLRRQIESEGEDHKGLRDTVQQLQQAVRDADAAREQAARDAAAQRELVERLVAAVQQRDDIIAGLEKEALGVGADCVFLRKQLEDERARCGRLQKEQQQELAKGRQMQKRIVDLKQQLDSTWRRCGHLGKDDDGRRTPPPQTRTPSAVTPLMSSGYEMLHRQLYHDGADLVGTGIGLKAGLGVVGRSGLRERATGAAPASVAPRGAPVSGTVTGGAGGSAEPSDPAGSLATHCRHHDDDGLVTSATSSLSPRRFA